MMMVVMLMLMVVVLMVVGCNAWQSNNQFNQIYLANYFFSLSFFLKVLKKDRVGPLIEYAAMYRQLGRTDVFRSEYCKARAAAAHKRWFASATSPSFGGGGAAGVTGGGLAEWLPSFLEYLQASL